MPPASGWSSHGEDELAGGVPRLAERVRLGRLGERERAGDARSQLFVLDEAGDRGHAAVVGLDEHEGRPSALGGGLLSQFRAAAEQRDEHATGADTDQGVLEALAAERVKDDIDVPYGLGDIGGAVVDDLVGAEAADEVVLGLARGAD